MLIKQFAKWIRLKEKLHNKNHKAPFVKEGEIWWASLGENVGSEINGKSDIFTRPAIIYKKLSHGFYFVIPTTTQPREGTWYVPFSQKGKKMNACLQQARSLDYRRLYSKLGELDDKDRKKVKNGFWRLYK